MVEPGAALGAATVKIRQRGPKRRLNRWLALASPTGFKVLGERFWPTTAALALPQKPPTPQMSKGSHRRYKQAAP
jgi:hypothetical protein